MNDERFEQDLRSVLLEDAPRDVPEDLVRRVAAIPLANPIGARPPRPAWHLPIPLWSGVFAILVVGLALVWRLGPTFQPGIGGQSSASLEPGASPSEVPGSSVYAVANACVAGTLTGVIVDWQGAAGSRIADVEISNTGMAPCVVSGTPGLELLDAGGHVLIDSMTGGPTGGPRVTPADPTFEVLPAGRVRTQVAASNYCGASPVAPVSIAFTMPSGGGRVIALPGRAAASADGIPPCLGSTGAHIGMNGWVR